MKCDAFELGADTSVYANEGRLFRPGVVFYARPATPRRGFGHGVMTLKLFHERHPEFQIHIIGRNLINFQLPFPAVNHGALGHAELNALYNRCSAGLVISFSNMSLLPLELLLTGCIPVVNDAPNTRMAGGSPYIEYAAPTPHALAEALCRIVERADLHTYASGASRSVGDVSWEEAGATVESIFLRELGLNAA